jgi:hypothetical protein
MMTSRYAERTPDRSGKAVIAVMLLALLLVAAVPVALLAGVVMMLLGHLIGGFALFGGSILAAAIAVAVAGMSGMRHLRKLISGRASVWCNWTGALTPTSQSPGAATTPMSCRWTAASTPKFADLGAFRVWRTGLARLRFASPNPSLGLGRSAGSVVTRTGSEGRRCLVPRVPGGAASFHDGQGRQSAAWART